MVSILLISAPIWPRFFGTKMAIRPTTKVTAPTPKATHKLPVRKVPMAAITMRIQKLPKPTLRLPPKGM